MPDRQWHLEQRELGVSAGTLSITAGAGLNNRATAAATIPLGALSGVSGTTLNGSDQSGASAGLVDNYNIGVLNTSTTFAGAIGNGTGSTNPHTTAITKVGTGTLTLSGSSTYKGTTTVSGGALYVSGTLANTSAVSVASGCSLLGTGTIGSTTTGAVTMAAASTTTTLSPGSAAGAYGTLTVGDGLTLNSTTLPLNLSNNPAGTNDNIQLQGGTLTLTGTNSLQLTLVNGALGAGVYTLIGGGSATSGTVSNITSNLPTGTRQTLALTVPTGKVILTVTGSAAPLVWTGANNSGAWDLDTTQNWTNSNNSGAADLFYNLDTVTFNDTSANGTVSVTGTVQPASIAVTSNTTKYTFSGTGTIAGPGTLTKSGTGTLTISNTGVNTFAGGVTVNAGVLSFTVGTALGTGTVTLNGGTLTFGASGLTVANSINVTAPSTWTVNSNSTTYWGGTLTGSSPLTMTIGSIFTPTGSWAGYSSTVTIAGSLRFNQGNNTWGSSTAAFNLGSTGTLYNRSVYDVTVNLGSLTGSSGSVLHGSDQAGPAVDTYLIGALNTSTVFAGTISDGVSSTSPHSVTITKVGTGSLTLSGAETYSGSTVVQGGTLVVSGSITSASGSTIEVTSGAGLSLTGGSLSADNIQIDTGGTLSGGGTLNGSLSITNNGTITASLGGTFTMTGEVVNNGTLKLTNGTTLNATGLFINYGTLDLTQGGQTLPPNLVNHGIILTAPVNTSADTPTMPEWALIILASLLFFAAGPSTLKRR